MSSSTEEKNQGIWQLLRPILSKYASKQKALIIFGILAGIVAAASAGYGIPFMLEHVFPVVFDPESAPEGLKTWLNTHLPHSNHDYILLWGAALLIPLVMFIRGMASYTNIFCLSKAGIRILSALRKDVFYSLQFLSFSYLDKRSRGEWITIALQYTQGVQQTMLTILNDAVRQPLTLLAALYYLISTAMQNEQTAALLGNFLIAGICVPLVRLVGRRIVKHTRKALAGMGRINARIEESFSAQREVRAFNLQAHQKESLKGEITFFNKYILRSAAWQHSINPAIEVVSALGLSFALYHGASDGLTLEQFSAVAAALYYCYDPLKRIGVIINQSRVMEVKLQGINEIIYAKDLTPEPSHPTPLPTPLRGEVNFENVSFGYNEEEVVLHDINVNIPAGQCVALVGPSGSGKTSFINLICRFYDAQEGRVSLDGIDVKQLSRSDRMNNIALVSQFAALFRGTIKENIRVGQPNASKEQLEKAAKQALVQEFTQTRNEGINMTVAEGGTGLSGGQKQRVSLARAFLKDAPILILDEATSALDMTSEARIQESLTQLSQERTCFIIAHRFSTIRMAQRILLFNEGRIIADGSHAELYERSALYRRLYDEQVSQQDSSGTTPEAS